MKKLLLAVILCCSYLCHAQNYQCLQSGVKHYFTNSNGYMRGIRIDSVRTVGTNVFYYPFHTPRGSYPLSGVPATLDSTGGSWLGKKVLQLSNGDFYFDNLRGYYILIRSLANLGDSWEFYSDTGSIYYRASIISIDTMSVLGAIDSVKTIMLNAYSGTSLVASDPLNGFKILLSKNHGFVQVFDLYTFPYHLPGAAYSEGSDYYLDNCISSHYAPFYIPSSGQADQSNSIFKIINLINPAIQQLYNWNVGDVYEYSTEEPSLPAHYLPAHILLDTVKTKTVTPGNVQYTYTGLVGNLIVPPPPALPTTYAIGLNSGMVAYDSSFLVDLTLMPEEYKQPRLYYYLPNDTSYCRPGTLYGWIDNYVVDNIFRPPFEATNPIAVYKADIGLVHYYQFLADGFDTYIDETKLLFYNKGGHACGDYHALLLPSEAHTPSKENTFTIFPNPASSSLTIQSGNEPISELIITNLLGQIVFDQLPTANCKLQTIDVSGFPGGIYLVKVNGVVQKFVKE